MGLRSTGIFKVRSFGGWESAVHGQPGMLRFNQVHKANGVEHYT